MGLQVQVYLSHHRHHLRHGDFEVVPGYVDYRKAYQILGVPLRVAGAVGQATSTSCFLKKKKGG